MNFAYLDPGTGSIVVQALIGVIAGGAFIFKNTIRRILPKFRKAGQQDAE